MDIRVDRKIEINRISIKVRWLYIFSIFFVGLIAQSLEITLVNYPRIFLIGMLFLFILINYLFYKILNKIELEPTNFKINFFSIVQIVIEVLAFAYITYISGGIYSISFLLFFIPIIFASLNFGILGSVLVSAASSLLIIITVYSGLDGIIRDASSAVFDQEVSSELSVIFSKLGAIFIFYLLIGIFSGLSANILFEREKDIIDKSQKLDEEKKVRTKELKKIDETASLLVDRDKELTRMNKELDKKVLELEEAEKSQMRAFRDLQIERRKTEEEKNKTDAIVSNFIDPIMVFDSEHKISLINPAAMEIFGLSEKSIGTKLGIKDNFSMENFRKLFNFEYTLKTAKELKIEDDAIEEMTFSSNDSELTYKVITAKVLGKNDEFFGTMKIFYNLTREKMIDKLKSEFISVAAHQLRTPLSAIKWVIKMVLDGDAGELNPEQEELLSKGYKSNERIINLVNDMLNVSRIEEGRFGYNFEQTNFIDVLDSVIDSLEGKLKEKKMKLFVKKPDNIPKINMDPTKMTMVLQNLTENAVKYTPEFGTVQINVEAGNKLLRVSIQDNGVGIPKADKEKLFSKFFRAANVVRLQTEGSGLGLFIVKNVIEKHGGTIVCNSEEGKGTEFIFTLPFDNKS